MCKNTSSECCINDILVRIDRASVVHVQEFRFSFHFAMFINCLVFKICNMGLAYFLGSGRFTFDFKIKSVFELSISLMCV